MPSRRDAPSSTTARRTPSDQDPAETIFDGSTDLRIVRLRLFLALVTMFAIPIAIAAPVIYGLASRDGDERPRPDHRRHRPGHRARRPHRLARPARPRAGRAPRPGAGHPRGRLRARPRRVPARLADRPRQPPRLPGGARAPVGRRRRATSSASPWPSSTSTTSGASTRPRATSGATACSSGVAATLTAGLRRTDRVFRIGGDEFAVLMPGSDAEASYLSLRRVLATALEGRAGLRARQRSRSARRRGRSRPASPPYPGTATDRADALPRGGRRADLREAPRPDRASRPSTPSGTTRAPCERPIAEVAAEVAQVAAVGALTRRLPADLRPAQRRSRAATRASSGRAGLRLRRSRRAVRRGRGGRPDRRAGPRLHGRPSIAGVRGAAPARQPDPQRLAAHARVGRLQRPRPGPAARAATAWRPDRVVLELTEREAVEDMDRLVRAVESCRAAGHAHRRRRRRGRQRRAAPAVPAPASTSSRSTCRSSRAAPSGPRPRRSCARSRTWPTGGARWSSPRASRRPSSSSSCARSGSAPARATCSAGRRTTRPRADRPRPPGLVVGRLAGRPAARRAGMPGMSVADVARRR